MTRKAARRTKRLLPDPVRVKVGAGEYSWMCGFCQRLWQGFGSMVRAEDFGESHRRGRNPCPDARGSSMQHLDMLYTIG